MYRLMYVNYNIFLKRGGTKLRKKILILLLVVILIFSGFVVNATDDNIKTFEKMINITNPVIIDEGQYIFVNLNEASSVIEKPGEPMLPIISQVFILPFGSKIASVDVCFSDFKQIQVSKEIKPVPGPIMLNNLVKVEETVKDLDIYDSAELYPSSSFVYNVGVGLDGLEHVVYLSVHCFPVRYSPKENMIYYSEEISIKIIYEEPSSLILSSDEYDLIIISPSKFSRNLQPLIEYKNSVGVRTIYKTTEEIYDGYQGRDEPEKIKYFIKEAIESWNAKYLLLVGDVDSLPIRYTKAEMFDVESLPTDLYYADIYDNNGSFCSWDTNYNDVFGEYDRHGVMIDYMDLYADINVGRIPCTNNKDLKIVVRKIITYETKTLGQDWFNRAILMGGDTFPDNNIYEGEIVLGEVLEQIPEFEPIKLFTSKENYNPININREITKGAGLVSYSGHGFENGFGTFPPNGEERIDYFTPYTIGMLNNNKFPVIFFDACCVATLDYNYLGIKLPCIAWYLIKKPVGGAIATIGSTRVAFTMVDGNGVHGGAGFMNVHFFKSYEPGIAVSQMLVSAQNDYINDNPWIDYFTLQEFILIGDPSLRLGGYSL